MKNRYISFVIIFVFGNLIFIVLCITFFYTFQEDFVEKNHKIIPSTLRSIIDTSIQLYEKPKPEHTKKTSAAALKNEIDTLIEQLKESVRDLRKLDVKNIFKKIDISPLGLVFHSLYFAKQRETA